jgi:hypothetical protein
LPAWWHHFESRATLVLELGLPFAIFGPRRARLGAAAAFTVFQVVNAATANYGFFCYLSMALHVFLLDDADVPRWCRGESATTPAPRPADPVEPLAADVRMLGRGAGALGVAVYVGLSLVQAGFHFGGDEPGAWLTALAPVAERAETFRLVNAYHLFASITRERIEPEFQTLDDAAADPDDDAAWTAQDLPHKPGDPRRAPDFVAPHQPRLDFQLWFHGLDYARGRPRYVHVLLERMCEDAASVRDFFSAPLPAHPRAVRVVYWRTQFSTPAEKRATGAWWRRERVAATVPVPCSTP